MADEATVPPPTAEQPGATSAVNAQVTDTIAAIQAAMQAGSAGQAAAMTELARVQADALQGFQAVARQQADATIMSAATAAACARMLAAPISFGGAGTSAVAMAEAQASAAIGMLWTLRDAAGIDGSGAAAALARLQAQAAGEPGDAAAKAD